MNHKNERYKNSPLAEAIFEIRFPAEPSIECNRDKFFERIRDKYPVVLVSQPHEGRKNAAQPYRFEKKDRSGGIILSMTNAALYTKKYERFLTFKDEVIGIFSILKKLFKLSELSRTGLRYINLIPFAREGNIIPIENYLNVHIGLPKKIPSDFKNLNIIFVSQTKGGSITTQIEPVISGDQTKEALILDFDFVKQGDLKFDLIEKYLDESHRHAKNFFENLIAEKYKSIMRGEVI